MFECFYNHDTLFEFDDFCIHLIENSDLYKKEKILELLFSYSSFNVIKYLFETKSEVSINIGIEYGLYDSYYKKCYKTPIAYACRRNLEELIIYLIDKKANLYGIDSLNNTAAHLICAHSTPEVLKYFLQNTNMRCGINLLWDTPYDCIKENYLMKDFLRENNLKGEKELDKIKLKMGW